MKKLIFGLLFAVAAPLFGQVVTIEGNSSVWYYSGSGDSVVNVGDPNWSGQGASLNLATGDYGDSVRGTTTLDNLPGVAAMPTGPWVAIAYPAGVQGWAFYSTTVGFTVANDGSGDAATGGLLLGMAVGSTFTAAPAFQAGPLGDTLSDGVLVVGAVAMGIAALWAGVLLWRTVTRYS